MTKPTQSISIENPPMEPFEDRIDILFHELELATKWQRPSVLLAIYSSEDVRADADIALENRLHNLGQSAYHIRIKNQKSPDVSLLISELTDFGNVVFFVEGLRWEAGEDDSCTYRNLNKSREFFVENQIRVVFWLTEHEAIDLAHFAPDYWSFRHRVIEFVDTPQSGQFLPQGVEPALQGNPEIPDSAEDLDARISLRNALLADLPGNNESTSTRANLLLTLGMLHWRKGDLEKALEVLNTALDMAAGMEDARFEASCFNAIALVDTDLGKTEEAIQAFKNATGLAPDQISPWNNLGALYGKLERYDEAVAAFQKAIEQNSSDAVAWNGLGELQLALGHNDDAIYAFLKATEFSPEYAPCWTGLGNSYLAVGLQGEALAAHRKAIEIDPQNIDSRFALGEIYMLQGKNEDASLEYRTLIELDPNNARAWNKLGDLHYRSGAFEQAQHTYQKAVDSDQDCIPSYGKLASIYIQLGRHAEAIPLLQKGIELSQEDTDTISLWNQMGDAYRNLDDYEHAMTAYHNADVLDPQKVSIPAESPYAEPDPQSIPPEDISIPSIANFKIRCLQEQALPSEKTGDDAAFPPEDLPTTNTSIPGKPKTIASWLDGLASFMTSFHRHEPGTATASNPAGTVDLDEGEDVREMQFDLPESTYPVFMKNEPIQSDQEDTANWYEPSPVLQDNQSAPDDPVIDEAGASARVEPAGQAAAAVEEENAHLWNELGSIYLNTGAYDQALNAFNKAIELDESNGWSYNNLAALYTRKGRYQDAIPLYQKGLKYVGGARDKALLWNRLGDAYRKTDEHDRAAAAYRKAIELDPENVSLLTRARLSLLGNCRA